MSATTVTRVGGEALVVHVFIPLTMKTEGRYKPVHPSGTSVIGHDGCPSTGRVLEAVEARSGGRAVFPWEALQTQSALKVCCDPLLESESKECCVPPARPRTSGRVALAPRPWCALLTPPRACGRQHVVTHASGGQSQRGSGGQEKRSGGEGDGGAGQSSDHGEGGGSSGGDGGGDGRGGGGDAPGGGQPPPPGKDDEDEEEDDPRRSGGGRTSWTSQGSDAQSLSDGSSTHTGSSGGSGGSSWGGEGHTGGGAVPMTGPEALAAASSGRLVSIARDEAPGWKQGRPGGVHPSHLPWESTPSEGGAGVPFTPSPALFTGSDQADLIPQVGSQLISQTAAHSATLPAEGEGSAERVVIAAVTPDDALRSPPARGSVEDSSVVSLGVVDTEEASRRHRAVKAYTRLYGGEGESEVAPVARLGGERGRPLPHPHHRDGRVGSPRSPHPDADQTAELDRLLSAAGVPDPSVLVRVLSMSCLPEGHARASFTHIRTATSTAAAAAPSVHAATYGSKPRMGSAGTGADAAAAMAAAGTGLLPLERSSVGGSVDEEAGEEEGVIADHAPDVRAAGARHSPGPLAAPPDLFELPARGGGTERTDGAGRDRLLSRAHSGKLDDSDSSASVVVVEGGSGAEPTCPHPPYDQGGVLLPGVLPMPGEGNSHGSAVFSATEDSSDVGSTEYDGVHALGLPLRAPESMSEDSFASKSTDYSMPNPTDSRDKGSVAQTDGGTIEGSTHSAHGSGTHYAGGPRMIYGVPSDEDAVLQRHPSWTLLPRKVGGGAEGSSAMGSSVDLLTTITEADDGVAVTLVNWGISVPLPRGASDGPHKYPWEQARELGLVRSGSGAGGEGGGATSVELPMDRVTLPAGDARMFDRLVAALPPGAAQDSARQEHEARARAVASSSDVLLAGNTEFLLSGLGVVATVMPPRHDPTPDMDTSVGGTLYSEEQFQAYQRAVFAKLLLIAEGDMAGAGQGGGAPRGQSATSAHTTDPMSVHTSASSAAYLPGLASTEDGRGGDPTHVPAPPPHVKATARERELALASAHFQRVLDLARSGELGEGGGEILITSDGWNMFDPALERNLLRASVQRPHPLSGGGGGGAGGRLSADDVRTTSEGRPGYSVHQTAFLDHARMSRALQHPPLSHLHPDDVGVVTRSTVTRIVTPISGPLTAWTEPLAAEGVRGRQRRASPYPSAPGGSAGEGEEDGDAASIDDAPPSGIGGGGPGETERAGLPSPSGGELLPALPPSTPDAAALGGSSVPPTTPSLWSRLLALVCAPPSPSPGGGSARTGPGPLPAGRAAHETFMTRPRRRGGCLLRLCLPCAAEDSVSHGPAQHSPGGGARVSPQP